MQALLLFLILVAIRMFLGGALLMMVTGAIHHEALPVLPAFGFRASVFLSIGLTLLGSYFYTAPSKS